MATLGDPADKAADRLTDARADGGFQTVGTRRSGYGGGARARIIRRAVWRAVYHGAAGSFGGEELVGAVGRLVAYVRYLRRRRAYWRERCDHNYRECLRWQQRCAELLARAERLEGGAALTQRELDAAKTRAATAERVLRDIAAIMPHQHDADACRINAMARAVVYPEPPR